MSAATESDDLALARAISRYHDDPLGHVDFSYPWGVEGTELAVAPFDSPDAWQEDLLGTIGNWCQSGADGWFGASIASGHGIGKGAVCAMLTKWFLDTRKQSLVNITANSKDQLFTKTWRELAIWHRRSATYHWYKHTGARHARVGFEDSWAAYALAWSLDNPEAIAGAHSKHIMVIFDEASAIPDEIWESVDGSMSTEGALWVCLGNPTRTKGRFRECFKSLKCYWHTWQLDARDCKFASKSWADNIVESFGDDSDYTRVRVKGEFPRSGVDAFFNQDDIDNAKNMAHPPSVYKGMPKVLSCDPARSGICKTVIATRQGWKLWPLHKFPGDMTGPKTALEIRRIDEEFRSDAILIGATGIGWSVIDSLRLMGLRHKVIAVTEADQKNLMFPHKYLNVRSEMYALFADWAKENGQIPSDDLDLIRQMEAAEYGWTKGSTKRGILIQIPPKDSNNSPDELDAVATGFASPVRREKNMFKPDAYDDSWIV